MGERVNFHWQNLNEKPADRLGTPLRNGRAWLRFYDYGLNWQWVLLSRQHVGVSFCVTQAEEIGVAFSLGVPWLFAFYVTVYGGWLARISRWVLAKSKAGYDDREISLRFHDTAIWWEVWRETSSWSSTTPRWRSGSFHFDDFFLGRQKHSERTLGTHETRIAMPEGDYEATVRLYESTWKRPRWFAKRMLRSEVTVPKGIPFPGKGENSWDCGEDALFGQSSRASTVEGAIAGVVESVLRSRRRYGGSVNWKPQLESRGVA